MIKLHLEMDTDDDCIIRYKGEDYCYYWIDLKIVIEGETLDECILQLLKDLIVLEGKADQFTKAWLMDSTSNLLRGEDVLSINGNQTYDMWTTRS